MAQHHKSGLILFDLLAINIACIIIVVFPVNIWAGITWMFLINSWWLICASFFESYKWYEKHRFFKDIKILAKILLAAWGGFLLIYFSVYQNIFQLRYVGYGFIVCFIAMISVRYFYRQWRVSRQRRVNYIIVGGTEDNITAIQKAFNYSFEKRGKCLGRFGNSQFEKVEHLGSYHELKEFVQNRSFHKIIYIWSELSGTEIREIIQIAHNKMIDFEVVPREIRLFPRGFNIQYHDNLPLLTLKEEPLFRLKNKLAKRIFDIVFSFLVILFVLSWLVPIIGLIIKLDSRGPIFFKQQRTGYWGVKFWCYKFRTMTVNKDSDKVQASKGDARITKIGEFLRKTSIDEIPQFINVFLGDMSVVGPRPHMLAHTEYYSNEIEEFMIRHKIKPGITGWAQIHGHRGPTNKIEDMRKRVIYDVWYVENWSLPLDIKCIIFTIFNVAKGEENAF